MVKRKIITRNILLFTVMIVAAISFAVSGAYVVKNEEKTQIILEDNFFDIIYPTSTVNYTLDLYQPFQFHEIHVKEKEGTGENNTETPGDHFSGIYVQIYDENMVSISPSSSIYLLSYYCATRNFTLIVTQMSNYLFTYEVELYSFYQDATANLWYIFSGFIGIWAVCIVLLFVLRREKDQVKAK